MTPMTRSKVRTFAPFVVVWVGALLLLVIVSATAHAEEVPTDDVAAVAEQIGMDPIALQGAVNTTGYDAHEYAYQVGLLARPYVPPPPPLAVGVFDLLAGCESSGNWASISNPIYKGGLQMDAAFWRNHGGLQYASAPQFASREQQIQVAINGRDGLVGQAQGWSAWPVCSKRLGLR